MNWKLCLGSLIAGGGVAIVACSNGTNPPDAGPDAASDAPLTCPSPGMATTGPADDHCTGQPVTVTNQADCTPEAGPPSDAGMDDGGGDAGPVDTCDFGDTMFGQQGDDDDCKYHVSWTSSPICEGAKGVTFTVTATYLTDNSPVTGMTATGGIQVQPFIPSVADAACDDKSTHVSPTSFTPLTETPPGSGIYVGPVVFDAPGDWTLRFHLFENCQDTFADSPHGHAAFHITVP